MIPMNKKEEAKHCIRDLLSWTPEGVSLEKISRLNYPVKDFGKVFAKGDDACPFFSEAYLYNLLGKEDARTLLALMRKLCRSLGVEVDL